MLTYIIQQAIKQKIQTPQDLAKIKREGSFRFKQKIPSNIQLLKVYHDLLKKKKVKSNPQLQKILKTREIRTLSGVAVITVLTKPWPCPGHCLYCPNEPKMPKSYLKNEPAAQRAGSAGNDRPSD
jgi:elongator complex protein 3